MKTCALLIFTLFTVTGHSQNTINAYKYILVPERFDFAKEDNQYGLNTTTKLLLEQKGFVAFVGNEVLPPALAANKCNALRAELVQKKSFFVIGVTLLLKDCQGNIIFKGKEGKSSEKDWQAGYDEALKNAISSLNDVHYTYDSTLLAQTQQGAPSAAVSPSVQVSAKSPVPDMTGILYAQVTPNGYQLIDTIPKKVVTLLKTSLQDYFIAEAGSANGIVFKREGGWVFEYYENDKLVSRKLEIKF